MQTMSKSVSPPKIGPKELAWQFWKDIYGKEVQSAATYSYLWLADQAGHIALGILIQYLLQGIAWSIVHYIPWVSSHLAENPTWAGFLLASLVVSLWETSAYRSSAKEATDRFPLNKKGLRNNAIIASVYMIIGAGIGFAINEGTWQGFFVFLACLLLAVILAPPWYREKIIWQKASIPYLFRLANFRPVISQEDADKIQSWLEGPVSAEKPEVFVVSGGRLSGRTPLATGVATEMAFRKHKVRFLGFNDLSDMAIYKESFSGPDNIVYWPWREAQVLVIDDVGHAFRGPIPTSEEEDLADFIRIVKEMKKISGEFFTDKNAIWLLDDVTSKTDKKWTKAIADLHGPNAKVHFLKLLK